MKIFKNTKLKKLENDPLAPGKMAPTFTEVMANGDSLSLEDLRGKVVFIGFLGVLVWTMQTRKSKRR
jgi:hypothetical protein